MLCSEPLRLLVVGGHPADVFDHCGGTLAHHTKRGDSVACLALTQGLRIHDVVFSERLRFGKGDLSDGELDALRAEREAVKYDEVRRACALFGVEDVRFLSYDDKVLLVTEDLIVRTAQVIRAVRPDILITHNPLENGSVGSHHGNTGKIVLHAVQCAGTVDLDDPNPGWRTPQVFFMSPLEATICPNALSAIPGVYCDYYVDVTDVAELKVRALDIMRSQQYGGDYAKRHTEVWSGKDGHFMSTGYAESFVRYKAEIGEFLTVSEELRQRANEPEAEQRTRSSRMIAEFMAL